MPAIEPRPGQQTPQLEAYHAHIAKLDLSRRCPLEMAALEKCG